MWSARWRHPLKAGWQNVMNAIHACHEALRSAHQRVLITITIDDDAIRALNMSEATAKVTARREEAKL